MVKNFLNTTPLLDETSLLNKNQKHKRVIYILDLLANLCIFTPLTIIYWIATWDFFAVFIFNENLFHSCLATLFLSNAILLCIYLVQDKLEEIHRELINKNKARPYKASLFRFGYSYFLSLAYVSQWRTYWDVFNYFTIKIDFEYSLLLSIITLLAYRFILKRSFKQYIKCIPFNLNPIQDYNGFFKQPKIIYVANVKFLFNFTKIIFKNNILF